MAHSTHKGNFLERANKKGKPKRIGFTEEVQREVIDLLSKDYSPEQIVGTLKLERKRNRSFGRKKIPFSQVAKRGFRRGNLLGLEFEISTYI